MNDILLNPLKINSFAGGIGYGINRILVMTSDENKIHRYLEGIEDKNIYSVLGLEKGVDQVIKFFEKKNYSLYSKTQSEFLVRKTFSPKIEHHDLKVSTKFISEDVVPIMADYVQTLRHVYHGEELGDLQAMLYARKSWQTPSFKYTFTLYQDKKAVSFMAADYLINKKLWLFCCATKREFQGQGLFRELFLRAQSELMKLGVDEVGLFCAREDMASKIYRKLGFRQLKKFTSVKVKSF